MQSHDFEKRPAYASPRSHKTDIAVIRNDSNATPNATTNAISLCVASSIPFGIEIEIIPNNNMEKYKITLGNGNHNITETVIDNAATKKYPTNKIVNNGE